MGKLGNPEEENKIPRRDFIKKLGILGVGAVIAPTELFSQTQERKELNRGIKSSEMVEMQNGGDMPVGFVRTKINIEFNDNTGKIEGVGSFFSLEDLGKVKAEFLSNKKHPEFFANGVNFDTIKSQYDSKNRKVALIVAGAYYASNTKQIEGIALEDGQMVGQNDLKSGSNGLLVIKNGNPEIQYVNQIPDFNAYLEELKRQNADVFQQSSYIRPSGSFNSSNTQKWELRFFVEGERNGVAKKGIINFSTTMTYTEAVEALSKMSGFKITKAIGLDTGNMSEGYFYDKGDKKYLMIDEQVGTHRDQYTNVVVLYNEK